MNKVVDVVRARRFELVDRKGKVRATLGVDTSGRRGTTTALVLSDAKEEVRAHLSVNSDRTTRLAFLDAKGKPRATLSADRQGTTILCLFDAKTEMRVILGAAGETTVLGPHASNGEMRARLALEESDGTAALVLSDYEGKPIRKAP